MRTNKIKLTAGFIFLILLSSFIVTASIPTIKLSKEQVNQNCSTSSNELIDITTEEVWTLVNDTSNGIQIPIDVRTDPEWANKHIQTPSPEHARHHCSCEWSNMTILQEFISLYDGKEIILYCKSGMRSTQAALTLINNDFQGTIYNMIGGITDWENKGYPTISNRAPESPQINGPTSGEKNQTYTFSISANDPDEDPIYFYIDWGDGQKNIYEKEYSSNDQIIFTHKWENNGVYQIQIKTRDKYFEESNWTTHQIAISQTDLEIIKIQGGIGETKITIQNNGEFTAKKITTSIRINGGLLSNININYTCSGCEDYESTLEPGSNKIISSKPAGSIIGLGQIKINITVSAENAEKITVNKNGIVLGPIIIIK